MEEGYHIRNACAEDLRGILKVLNQLSPTSGGDPHLLLDILQEIVGDYRYCLSVVNLGDDIVGSGMLTTRCNLSHKGRSVGYLENIVVDKKHRKKGIGEAIVEHLKSAAKSLDCYKVILDCAPGTFHFYRKLDFRTIDEKNMRWDC